MNPTDMGGELKACPFEREERYIVIKRKHLSAIQETALRAHMARLGIGIIDCAVVERDWPEYEPVWRMIEDRVTGNTRPSPVGDVETRTLSTELGEAANLLEVWGELDLRDACREASSALSSLQSDGLREEIVGVLRDVERAFEILKNMKDGELSVGQAMVVVGTREKLRALLSRMTGGVERG